MVLLIDNNTGRREAFGNLLRSRTRRVIAAGSLEEGRDQFSRWSQNINVVVLRLPFNDHNMRWLFDQIMESPGSLRAFIVVSILETEALKAFARDRELVHLVYGSEHLPEHIERILSSTR